MSAKLKILEILNDWEFHSNMELLKIWWHRFWWLIFSLKKMWFIFEKKWNAKTKDKIEYFKLIQAPEYKVVNQTIMTNAWKISRIEKKLDRMIKDEEKPKNLFTKILQRLWIQI